MAENQTVTEDASHRHPRGTSAGGNPKGQSASSGTGSMTSSGGIASKPNSLKHVGSLTSSSIGHHPPKAASMISPESKHHHHHHHHHHHSHSHHSTPHVIHRTTSESLRLGGTDLNVASGATSTTGASSPSTNSSSSGTTNCNSSTPQLHLSAPGMRKPKTSSFQITSVTVGNKLSADNGEDSADDLDESHTDDNSRITDLENETPSVSEDTFSKEDVFFSSNALGTAPVIPTSSQYGLVIVDPDLGGVGGTPGQTLSNVHVSVTDAGINIVGPNGGKLNDADQKDLQHRNERFKVVKIESTEPFKRGRWMCMDYLDHTTLQQTQSPNAESASPPSTGTGNVATNDSGVAVSENHVDSGGDAPESTVQPNFQSASPGQTLQNPITIPASTAGSEQPPLSQPATNPTGSVQTAIQAQTMGHVPNAPSVGIQQQQPQQNITAQSLPPTQLQQAISGQVPSQPQPTSANQTVPEYANATANSNLQGQSQPANFYMNNQQPPTSAPSNHPHGATLPTNIQMQNGVPTNLPCSTQPPPPQQQQSQPQQPQQPQQPPQQPPASQPQTLSSVPMAVPSSVLPSEQANISASSSVSQTMVPQPVQPQQPAGSIIQPQQGQTMTTPHSAPQSQVSSEMFIPQSAPQSYAGPPVSTATIPSVSSSTSIAQDVPVDVPVAIPSAQQPTVISPAGGGGTPAGIVPAPAPAEGAATPQQAQQPQQPPQQQPQPAPAASAATPGIPNVMQDTAAASQPSTISDPAVIAAAIQAQQQVTAPPATLQTQQSVVASDETAQPAVDTDSESVSSLALALSSNKKSVANRCTAATTSAQPCATYSSSKNTTSRKSSTGATLKQKPKSSVFTNLALGKCIQKLMGVSMREIPMRTERGKEALEEAPKVESNEEPRGILIPKSPKIENPNIFDDTNEGMSDSSSSPSTLQVASSYDAGPCGCNPITLRAIGKTNSIPVGCYTYKTDSGLGNCRNTSTLNTTSQPCHRRTGSVSAAFENSASGTSAVAIDNKIEQAMDLVKSHLMIAVREEVEVLKEKIAELMDRINQLELENTILKANVSQETLSQLSQTMQTTSTKAPQNTNTSNGPVS